MSFVSSNRTTFLLLIIAVALIFLLPLVVQLPDESAPKKNDIPGGKSDQPSADSLIHTPNTIPADSLSN